jgi:hypothetical protein
MATKPSNGRNIEAEVSALFTAAVGNGLQRPEDAWVTYTASENAENDGYGPGYVYVRRFSPRNPERKGTVAQIKPSMRKYLLDGLCVEIEHIPKDPQGAEWRVRDFGVQAHEQYLGTVPAEAVADTDLPDTAVTPGSYTAADITVDAKGRITAAADGSPDAANVAYTPDAPSQWPDPDPVNVAEGLDSLADQVDTLTGLVGGGAPDTANYIVGVASAGLSAETVIPGLRGSPDIAGAAGGGISEEYDTGTTGLTWNSAPDTENSNTTVLSHLYVKTTGTTEHIGTRAWSPAGAFDVRMKMALGSESVSATALGAGLHIGNSGDTSRLLMQMVRGSTGRIIRCYTYAAGTYTQRGSDVSTNKTGIYFRITRDGSNNVRYYFSDDGMAWQFVATQSFTFTVANIGYRILNAEATVAEFYSDWLRTDVV